MHKCACRCECTRAHEHLLQCVCVLLCTLACDWAAAKPDPARGSLRALPSVCMQPRAPLTHVCVSVSPRAILPVECVCQIRVCGPPCVPSTLSCAVGAYMQISPEGRWRPVGGAGAKGSSSSWPWLDAGVQPEELAAHATAAGQRQQQPPQQAVKKEPADGCVRPQGVVWMRAHAHLHVPGV